MSSPLVGSRDLSHEDELVVRALHSVLEQSQMNQAEWAIALGISRAAISQWLSGKTRPTAEHILRLITILRSRAICDSDSIYELESVVGGRQIWNQIGNHNLLSNDVADELARYLQALPYRKVELLKKVTMALADDIATPESTTNTLWGLISNGVEFSDLRMSTTLRALSLSDPATLARSLQYLQIGSSRTNAPEPYVWVSLAALLYEDASDSLDRSACISAFQATLTSQEWAARAEKAGHHLRDHDPVVSAISLFARTKNSRHEPASDCVTWAFDAFESVPLEVSRLLMAEVARRGRHNWMSDADYRSLLRSLAKDGERSLSGPICLSRVTASNREVAEDKDLIGMLERVWSFIAQPVTEGNDAEDETSATLLNDLVTRLAAAQSSEQKSYALTAGIYDLLVEGCGFWGSDDTLQKSHPETFDSLRRFVMSAVQLVLADDTAEFSAIALLDIGCSVLPWEMIPELLDSISLSTDRVFAAICCSNGPWSSRRHFNDVQKRFSLEAHRRSSHSLRWICSSNSHLAAGGLAQY